MPSPQALVEFPGLPRTALIGGRIVMGRGISPLPQTITVAPYDGNIKKQGDLVLTYDRERIVLKNCIVDSASSYLTEQGEFVDLEFLDRRWKWTSDSGGGKISGHYNVLQFDKIVLGTEKKPQELAKLLLDAMGETGYDVSKLPNNSRPLVEWENVNPASALSDLCESLGCIVVLGLDDRVRIEVVGKGRELPANDAMLADGFALDPPERPDRLDLVLGPTQFQIQVELEAVGEDLDGRIKPVDKLSYKPTSGWKGEYPGFFSGVPDDTSNDQRNDNTPFQNNTTQRKRRLLCQNSVYKFYRLKLSSVQEQLKNFKELDTEIKRLSQIVINDGLVARWTDPTGVERRQPEFVEGLHWDRWSATGYNTNGRTTEGFNIDRERHLVVFGNYVFRTLDDGSGYAPAKLYLTCNVSVREPDTQAFVRRIVKRDLPGEKLGTLPRPIARDDISFEVEFEYGSNRQVTGQKTNDDTIKKESKFYLDAAEKEYEVVTSKTIPYAGWLPISPDGAIEQVEFSFGEDGAFTTASRNTEHLQHVIPSYAERRRREKAEAILAKQQASVAKFLRPA